MCAMPLISRNAININFIFDFDIFTFLGLGDLALFHWRLCPFVSGLYSKIQLSFQEMTLPSKFGSVSRHSRMSLQTSTLHSFWLSENSLGTTIFAQILRIPKSSVMILETVSLLMDSSLTIICTVRRQSAFTSCFTCSVLSAVLLVEGLLDLWSSSTSLRPSLNRLCHSNTRVRDMSLLPYTCCSSSRHSEGVLPSRTRNFRLVLFSRFILWRLSSHKLCATTCYNNKKCVQWAKITVK